MATAAALLDAVLTALDDALEAGPAVVAGAVTVGALATSVREAGARVPAFVQLGAKLDAFVQRAAADTLLDAVAVARRMRLALLDRAVVEPYPLDPLEPTEPLGTPLDTGALAAFYVQLAACGNARAARAHVLTKAIDGGLIGDLRMLPYWRAALRDKATELAVLERVVPVVGRALADDVRARMNASKLEPHDAARLVAYASAAPDEARSLALEAARSRLPVLRSAGLRALAWCDPAAAEPLGLAVLADARSASTERTAAADALGRVASDAALVALVREVWQGGPHGDAAQRALATTRYEPVAARLLAEARALCTPGRALGHADTIARSRFVALLGRRRPAAHDALAFLIAHLAPHDPVRDDASRALVALGERAGLEAVAARLAENDWQSLELALDALLVLDPSTLFDRAQTVLAPELTAYSGESREHAAELLVTLGRLCATPERPDGTSRAARLETLREDPRWEAYAATFPRESHAKVQAAAHGLVTALRARR